MMRTQLLLVVVAALFLTHPAAADVPFVERPLTLAPGQASADVGIGFAQTDVVHVQERNGYEEQYSPTYKVGWGGSLEWAIGLPYVGQLGLRVGFRPDDAGQYSNADAFGRVLDPLHYTYGITAVTWPELDWRKTLFTPGIVEIGVDVRVLTNPNGGPLFAFVAGVPVRVHLSRSVRLDTGIYFATATASPFSTAAQIPAQLFFQAGDTFFGPEVSIFSNSYSLADAFPVGFAIGHTFGGIVDVKAEARVNELSRPEHTLSGGIGVGVRF